MHSTDTLAYFQSSSDSLVEKIREIVEMESPSCDPERNRAVTHWVENEAVKTGIDLEIEKIPADGYGEHLIIRAFKGEGKPLLLLGHTDTVHPVGAKLLNPTRIEDGRFYGCGIFDMKANVVLMIAALQRLQAIGQAPPRPVTIFLSCDEEVGSYTGRPLLEAEAGKASHCLIFEPSAAGLAKTGRKGTAMYTLRARGIPAHAGLEPDKGASAILELARQVEVLHTLNDPGSGTTVNVCTFSGGTTTNVIPEHAACTVDVRFSSLEAAEHIHAAITGLLPADDRVALEITGGINRPPLERTDAIIDLFRMAQRAAGEFGYELGETQVGGASDGNFVAALGVPVLDGLGVKGDGAHTLHEYIQVSDLAPRATLLTLLINTIQ